VVRIILLPALMLLIGERVWWLPEWLGRVLPRLEVEVYLKPTIRKSV
jgi:RND superfamily putative drug exporter